MLQDYVKTCEILSCADHTTTYSFRCESSSTAGWLSAEVAPSTGLSSNTSETGGGCSPVFSGVLSADAVRGTSSDALRGAFCDTLSGNVCDTPWGEACNSLLGECVSLPAVALVELVPASPPAITSIAAAVCPTEAPEKIASIATNPIYLLSQSGNLL